MPCGEIYDEMREISRTAKFARIHKNYAVRQNSHMSIIDYPVRLCQFPHFLTLLAGNFSKSGKNIPPPSGGCDLPGT